MSSGNKFCNKKKWGGESDKGAILARVINEGLSVEVTLEYRPENVREQAMRTYGRPTFQENPQKMFR